MRKRGVGIGLVLLALQGCRSPGSSNAAGPLKTAARTSEMRVQWQPPLELARGEAYAGPWRMNESDFRYVDDPTIARRDEQLGVAWVDNARKNVLFQAYDSSGRARHATPVNVSRSPQIFSWLPRVLLGRDNSVFVLWQEIVFSGGSHGGEVFFARSRDGGQTFDEPLNLSNSTGGDGKGRLTREHWDNGSLDLIQAPGGALMAAWTEYDGKLWFSRSKDQGRSFSAPLHVAGSDNEPARAPSLTATHDRLYLAWTVGEDSSANLRFSLSTDGGSTFEAPRIVSAGVGRADAPKTAVDSSGVVHLVYAEAGARRSGESDVLYTQLKPSQADFAAPSIISRMVGENSGASFPSLSVATENRIYVVWHHHATRREQARALAFTASCDGGQSFSNPKAIPASADSGLGALGSRQGKLMHLLATEDQSIAVVGSWFREGHASVVRLFLGQVEGDERASR
jgi:hypothetical protein